MTLARCLLQDFASRGGTVILSSHLLGEVQATVDRLVVIGGGRIVANGSLEEMLAGSGTLVRGLDPIGLNEALTAAGLQFEPLHDGGRDPGLLHRPATAWALAGSALFKDNANWLDVFGRIAERDLHVMVPETLTAIGLWIVLPTIVGLWARSRREVK
jgi:hypothetical protein